MNRTYIAAAAVLSALLLKTAFAAAPAPAPTPFRAWLVDGKGKVYAERLLRDPRLCGQAWGPAYILEGLPQGMRLPPMPELRVQCLSPDLLTRYPRVEQLSTRAWPGSEVRTLIQQGPSANRIDLTIVGDGYTADQKETFFRDADLIAQDLFGDETFHTYLPLFNVHAVFVPSNLSGLGDGQPKDTALRLYRHPSIRQAVMPSNEALARRAVALAPATDYPILVSNDPIYGGLGGAFAITTASPLNRTTVLRHELGHNFGRVGEEYDGGQVYRGANHAASASSVGWSHWLSRGAQLHAAQQLAYSAPWQNLAQRPFEKTFNMPAGMTRLFLDFSSLGFDSPRDVALLIDGREVRYEGDFNYDRNFYRVEERIPAGRHILRLEERVADGNNVLSKVGIYALPDAYPNGTPMVAAFKNYGEMGGAGVRPTDRGCLMRDMKLRNLCVVCVENVWRNFLREISLIDGAAQDAPGAPVLARVLPLGQPRLRVDWIDPRGQVRPDLAQKLAWQPQPSDVGRWGLRVHFVSPEVRDPNQGQWATHSVAVDVR